MPEEAAEAAAQKTRREIADAIALSTQLGLGMFACLFVGVVLGNVLDRRLHTSPLLLLLGALLGGAASIKVLYDLAIKKWMK